MSGSIYMKRNKSFKYTFLFFELKSCGFFKNNFFIVLNTYHLLSLTTHKNILSFTKFYGKRKYYRESLYPTSNVGSQG